MSKFIRPVDNAITQQWGASPAYYSQFGQNGHTGIDYGSPLGTPIRATGNGRVVFAGNGAIHGGFLAVAGNAMLIDHGDIYSAYSHMSAYEVGTGVNVRQGQIIGYTGNTGLVTGPHLHFEFWGKPTNWKNGWSGRVNPNDYLGNEGDEDEMQPTTYEVANIYAQALLFRDMSHDEWQKFHAGKSRNKLFDDFNSSYERRNKLAEFSRAIADFGVSKADRVAMTEALEKARIAQEQMEEINAERDALAKSVAELEATQHADKVAGESFMRQLGQLLTKLNIFK